MTRRIKKMICLTLPQELNKIWGEYVLENKTNKSQMLEKILIDILKDYVPKESK